MLLTKEEREKLTKKVKQRMTLPDVLKLAEAKQLGVTPNDVFEANIMRTDITLTQIKNYFYKLPKRIEIRGMSAEQIKKWVTDNINTLPNV